MFTTNDTMSRPPSTGFSHHMSDEASSRGGNTSSVDHLCRLLTESIRSLASDAGELRVQSIIASQLAESSNTVHQQHDDRTTTRMKTIQSLKLLEASLLRVESDVDELEHLVHDKASNVMPRAQQVYNAVQQHEQLTAMAADLVLIRQSKHKNISWIHNSRPEVVGTSSSWQPNQQPVASNNARPSTPSALMPRSMQSLPLRNLDLRRVAASKPEASVQTRRHHHHNQTASGTPRSTMPQNGRRPDESLDSNGTTGTSTVNSSSNSNIGKTNPPVSRLLSLDTIIGRDELEAIPRTSRGRLALSVLNDALRDMASLCRKKHRKLLALQQQQQQAMHGGGGSSSTRIEAHKENCRHRTSEDDSDMYYETMVLMEQEVRQSCAFFRTGESTARSILLVLRMLGRLQQVPAKTGNVQYMAVFQPSSSSSSSSRSGTSRRPN